MLFSPWLSWNRFGFGRRISGRRAGSRGRRDRVAAQQAPVLAAKAELLEQRAMLTEFVVTTASDLINPNDGALSLREAIILANQDPTSFDTITFDSRLDGQVIKLTRGTLTGEVGAEDGALLGDLDITGGLEIIGNGPEKTIIDGNGTDRVFEIIRVGGSDGGSDNGSDEPPMEVLFSSLTIRNGFAREVEREDAQGNEFEAQGIGGGILNVDANLTLQNVHLINNRSERDGGGLYNDHGHVEIYDSRIANNSAGLLEEEDEVLSEGYGGGLFTVGEFEEFREPRALLIFDSLIEDNFATVSGGGIFAYEDHVEIHHSEIAGNDALFAGGGIATYSYPFKTASTRTLLIHNSTISGNTAGSTGGGIYNFANRTELHDTDIASNTAGRSGGGIYTRGFAYVPDALILDNSRIDGNSAGEKGGGIGVFNGNFSMQNNSEMTDNTAIEGGGIFKEASRRDGQFEISDSVISGNTARGVVGQTYEKFDPVNFEYYLYTPVRDAVGGGLALHYGVNSISKTLITNNQAIGVDDTETNELQVGSRASSGSGGGIAVKYGRLELSQSIISNNHAIGGNGNHSSTREGNGGDASGGGISIQGFYDTEFYVYQSTFSDNQANGGNASVEGFSGGDGYGGGLFIFAEAALIEQSTFSGNQANAGLGELGGEEEGEGEGGGLWNSRGRVSLLNSTFSGNTATHDGGGIYTGIDEQEPEQNVEIRNTTITRNRADSNGDGSGGAGGGLSIGGDSGVFVTNSIVAGNVRGNSQTETADDISGTVIESSSYNVIGDAATAGGMTDITLGGSSQNNIVGNDGVGTLLLTTILDPTLADNGGPTFTHALVTGSPALNSADPLTAEIFDQRSLGRTDSGPDRGAVEQDGTFVEYDEFHDITVIVTMLYSSEPVTVVLTGVAKVAAMFEGPNEGDARDDDTDGLDEIRTYITSLSLSGTFGRYNQQLSVNGLYRSYAGAGVLQENVQDVSGGGTLDVAPFGTGGSGYSYYDLTLGFQLEREDQFLQTEFPIHLEGLVTAKPFGLNDRLVLVLPEGRETIPLLEPTTGEPFIGYEIVDIVAILRPQFDFGDAPDSGGGGGIGGGGIQGIELPGNNSSSYGTLLSNNGARHLIVEGGPILGTKIDAETDGQPTFNADGDDSTDDDDEDGVVFVDAEGDPLSTLVLLAGQTGYVQVTASAPGYLNAWIDFDGDGSWHEYANEDGYDEFDNYFFREFNPERIFFNVAVDAGVNDLDFAVPLDVRGQEVAYVRFRLTSEPMSGQFRESYFSPSGIIDADVVGVALDGEVEDYAISIITAPRDYGDLPSDYPTTHDYNYFGIEVSPAFHTIVDGIHLGETVDAEPDGQPSDDALGDDENPESGPDDEDGVVFVDVNGDPLTLPVYTVGQTGYVKVTASAPGFLNAWIDFNGNRYAGGAWDDGLGFPFYFYSETDNNDQIATDVEFTTADFDDGSGGTLASAFKIIQFTVSGAPEGEVTYARFRFSTQAGLGPIGGAPDGEVEDYRIEIQSFDFGDAPISYGTLLTNNGPSHRNRGPSLNGRDSEADGQPNSTATGDDAWDFENYAFFDDEEGVDTRFTIVVSATSSTVTVPIRTFGGGYLNAWIDFGADGSFDQPGDRIFINLPVVDGQNSNLTFELPNDLGIPVGTARTTFSRFRLTSQPSSTEGFENAGTPYGAAPDGEVEDHLLTITQPVLPTDTSPTGSFVFAEVPNGRNIYDPAIAIGYDYFVSGGDGDGRFIEIALPVLGDNLYTLHLPDEGGFAEVASVTLRGGDINGDGVFNDKPDDGIADDFYDLDNGFWVDEEGFLQEPGTGTQFAGSSTGFQSLRILGIEVDAGVDPENAEAFVTTLNIADINTSNSSAGSYTFEMAGIPQSVYVDNAGDFVITSQVNGGTSGLDAGDIVTWRSGQADEVTGLRFGFSAFATIQDAINFVEARDISHLVSGEDFLGTTIQIGPGTFNEKLTINGTTLIGAGDEDDGDPETPETGTIIDGTNLGVGLDVPVITISSGAIVTLTGVRITGGESTDGDAGGIRNNGGNLTISNSTVIGNSADSNGGGIYSVGGSLTLNDTRVLNNTAGAAGGGIYATGGAEVTITDSTISGNIATDYGGGIYAASSNATLTVTNSTISGNRANEGGGIYSDTPDAVVITGTTIDDNRAFNRGGGIWFQSGTLNISDSTISNNTASNDGGGIDIFGANDVTILNTTLHSNTSGSDGGAIQLSGPSGLSILNSTISGNQSTARGGGIGLGGTNSNVTIVNSTITLNRSDRFGTDAGNGGGIFNDSAGTVLLHNSIVAGNVKGAAGVGTPDDIQGDGVSSASSFNLIGNAASSGGLIHGGDENNIVGEEGTGTLDINRILDVNLANNGGSTQTHRLVFGSLAVDSGSNAIVANYTIGLDQRGRSRISDGDGDFETTAPQVDRGAYERGATVLTTFDIAVSQFHLDFVVESQVVDSFYFESDGQVVIALEYFGADEEAVGTAFDTDGDGFDQIPIEIVSLQLFYANGDGVIILRGGAPAQGQLQEQNQVTEGTLDVALADGDGSLAADSFFDVFFEVTQDGITRTAADSVRIRATLNQVSPEVGDVFEFLVDQDHDPVNLLEEGEPTGLFLTGFKLMPVGEFDYGDAPDPLDDTDGQYPTRFANNGARHVYDPDGPRLGTNLDPDFDGIFTEDADGDDFFDGGDDDDGVTWGTLVAGTNVDFVVNASLGSGGAVLDAWIDFNQNGIWEASEQIADDGSLVEGDNNVTVALASSLAAGDYYARFRISSNGVAGPDGLASDGEVEDYKVAIIRQADLDIGISDNDGGNPIVAGAATNGSVTYVVTVNNFGPSDASNVKVTNALSLPAGTSLISVTPSSGTTADSLATFAAGSGVWTIGDLAADTSVTLTLVVRADASAANDGTISIGAEFSSRNESDPASGDTDTGYSETDIVRRVDIAVTKSDSDDPVIVTPDGGPVTFTYNVTVTNNGPSDATNITIEDLISNADLPVGVTLTDVDVSQGTATLINGALDEGTWSVGDLAVDTSATLTLEITVQDTVLDGTTIENTASLLSVSETEIDEGDTNNSATQETTVRSQQFVVVEVDEDDNLSIIDYAGEDNDITITRTRDRSTRKYVFVVKSKANDLTDGEGSEPTNEIRILESLVTGGLFVDLGDGDDKLDSRSIRLDATVIGGDGDDDIFTGSGDDSVNGGFGRDSIRGGSGNDRLDGGDDNDTVNGDSGNDTVTGAGGTDDVIGGSGKDVWYESTDAEFVTINSRGIFGLGASSVVLESFGSGIEGVWIDGGESENNFNAADSRKSVTLSGGAGADQLIGGRSSDLLIGGSGEDRLTANAGNDTVLGGEDNDEIFGGSGNDLIDGGAGDDAINGGTGHDIINGGDNDDFIDGDRGRDTILGGSGNDELYGGSGSDRDSILGEEGNDYIDGGAGRDRVTGGGNGIATVPGDDTSANPSSEVFKTTNGLMFDFAKLLNSLDLEI